MNIRLYLQIKAMLRDKCATNSDILVMKLSFAFK